MFGIFAAIGAVGSSRVQPPKRERRLDALAGVARIMDLNGSCARLRRQRSFHGVILSGMRSDWIQIGGDFRTAIAKIMAVQDEMQPKLLDVERECVGKTD